MIHMTSKMWRGRGGQKKTLVCLCRTKDGELSHSGVRGCLRLLCNHTTIDIYRIKEYGGKIGQIETIQV